MQRLPARSTGPRASNSCASGGLGHGLPAARRSGARPAQPAGDCPARGRIEHVRHPKVCGQAARESLPIVFIIVNNRAYAALDEFRPPFRPSASRSGPRCRTSTSPGWPGTWAAPAARYDTGGTRHRAARRTRLTDADPDRRPGHQLSVIVPGHSLALRHPLVVDRGPSTMPSTAARPWSAGSPATGSARQEPGSRPPLQVGAPALQSSSGINMSAVP